MEKDLKTLIDETNSNIEAIKDSTASKEDLTMLEGQLSELKEKGATKDQIDEMQTGIDAIKDSIAKQGEKLAELSKGNKSNFVDTKKSFTEKSDSIKETFNVKRGEVDIFEQKAVALVTTANATTNVFASQNIINTNEADESNAGMILRGTWIENFASVSRINRAYYSYVDWKPKDGDAATVAEGGAKPQIDFQSVATQVAPTKVAGYIALTEESVTDVDEMDSVARDILMRKVMLKRQSNILTYLTGTVGNAFTTGTALAGTVKDPNLLDAIQAAATQIYTTENYTDDIQMMPNVAFVNPNDYYELFHTKDANNNYLYLQLAGVPNGVTIVPKTDITAGSVLVGDFTKLNIKNYIDYSVRLGWINEQFIENEFTMVGETRYFAFVKTLDQKAFIYDTISNITTDINKP